MVLRLTQEEDSLCLQGRSRTVGRLKSGRKQCAWVRICFSWGATVLRGYLWLTAQELTPDRA